MSDIAYDKRNIKLIKRKEKYYITFLFLRKIFRIIIKYKNRDIKNICIYPVIDNKEKLIDILNRILWALPYKKDIKIYIPVKENMDNFKKNNLPKFQRNYINNKKDHIVFISEKELKEYINKSKLILLHNLKSIFKIFFKIHKIEIIDKYFYHSTESRFWMNALYFTLNEKEIKYFNDLSKINFLKLLNKNRKKVKCYCFVTGPSFDKYKEFNYEKNSLKVICNSIIKNKEFLKYIKGSDIFAFSDPVFHFSSCEYSAVFRDQLKSFIKNYDSFIIVPYRTVPLLLSYFPSIKDRIIGLKETKKINFPNQDKLEIKISGNVLTQYMLPIASSISNKIYILGADGRKKEEKYFWKHSSLVQYDNLMISAFETHPSFFRDRDYGDYYEKHCAFFEKLVKYGELKGEKYYSLTPSYIQVLNKRYIYK